MSETEKRKISDFYQNFLTSFQKGAQKELGFTGRFSKKIGSSNTGKGKRESNTLNPGVVIRHCVTAYYECAMYGLQQELKDPLTTATTISEEHIHLKAPSGLSATIFTQVGTTSVFLKNH